MVIKHEEEINSYIQVTTRSVLSRGCSDPFTFHHLPPPSPTATFLPVYRKPIPPLHSWSQQLRHNRTELFRASGEGEASVWTRRKGKGRQFAEVSQQPEGANACGTVLTWKTPIEYYYFRTQQTLNVKHRHGTSSGNRR